MACLILARVYVYSLRHMTNSDPDNIRLTAKRYPLTATAAAASSDGGVMPPSLLMAQLKPDEVAEDTGTSTLAYACSCRR